MTLGSYDEWLMTVIAQTQFGLHKDYLTQRQSEAVQRLVRMGYVQPRVNRWGGVSEWYELTEAGLAQVGL